MQSISNEQIKATYTVLCTYNTDIYVVRLNEVDMNGWILFECTFLLTGQVVYFGQDREEEPIEYIEIEDNKVRDEFIEPLIYAISKRKAA